MRARWHVSTKPNHPLSVSVDLASACFAGAFAVPIKGDICTPLSVSQRQATCWFGGIGLRCCFGESGSALRCYDMNGRPILMNKIERYISKEWRKPLRSNEKGSEAILISAATLLAEAEALMGTCRELIHQSLNLDTQDGSPHRDWLNGRASESPIRLDAVDSPKLDGRPSDFHSDGTSPQVNLDILEMVVSRFPELIRGSAVFFVVLIENSGRVVSHDEMRALLRSNSQSIMKVHASKVRKVLRENNIDISVTSVRGGYGLSSDSVNKIMSDLKFSSAESTRGD